MVKVLNIAVAVLTMTALAGCGDDSSSNGRPPVTYPRLMARPEHRELVLERIEREPYATILADVQDRASRVYEEDEDPEVWDARANGENGKTAHANAFLAWVFDDGQAAEKARQFFTRLQTHWDTQQQFDIHIRMPESLMGYTNAWDLLKATPYFPEDEAEEAAAKITEINRQFFEYYLEDEAIRDLILGLFQNNYNIRTAASVGYVALGFPYHPDASKWANWAFSEMDYLWGPSGHYVQPDGGVSEGPHYFEFSWGVSAALFIAYHNAYGGYQQRYPRDCRTRAMHDPWDDHGCVEGEPFVFENPIYGGLFHAAAKWSLAIRLPWGTRPPLADADYNAFNGNALLTGFGGGGMYRWDWESNRDRPYAMHRGCYLSAHHLIYFDDSVAAEPPAWTSRFLPEAGNVIFRSDWSEDARWLLLVAEYNSVRKTVHDHVDGTSISLAAYGEYLLIDTGYYKPDPNQNARTADSDAHNVVLIDGKAAPDKGILVNFRDADAWIRNTIDGVRVEYAEAHQDYQDSHVERSVAFVDGRYFVMCDWIETQVTEEREHAFRLNGYAGYGSGGTFLVREDGARWERDTAGVDVFVTSTATGFEVVEPPFVEFESPHVHQFNWNREINHHGVMDGVVHARAPTFLSVLAPYSTDPTAPAADQPLAVDRPDLGEEAVAFVITGPDTTDLALVRSPQAAAQFSLPGGLTVETDARFIVVRLSGSHPFAVLVRGTYIILDGQPLAVPPAAGGAVLFEGP